MSLEIESLVRDLLPGYALDILTDDDATLVAEHLALCASCREELARLQLVADNLPLALVQSTPPPALKNKILAAIHPREASTTRSLQPALWQQLMSFMRRSAPAWAIAIIGVLAVLNWSLWNRLNQSATQATPAMRVVALVNTEASPSAIGTLIMDQHGTYGTLVVDRLEVLSTDQQYQVWLIQDGNRASAGLFSVNYEGYASLELKATQPLIQFDAIGITVEPAGGSPGPTGVKVLGGELSKEN